VAVGSFFADHDIGENLFRINGFQRAMLLVLAGLDEVRAGGRTVQRDLAFGAAADGADLAVDGGTETFFLAGFANGAAHRGCPSSQYFRGF
jgi:hypothetical protein